MGELVSRTVRFPEDIIAYIDAQEGTNFSKKLVGILYEYKDGDALRAERMARYDRYIGEQRELLQGLTDRACDVSRICRDLEDISGRVRDISDSLPGGCGPPA